MDISIIWFLSILSFAIFFIPKKIQYYFGATLQFVVIAITSIWATGELFQEQFIHTEAFLYLLGSPVYLTIDNLSAFFILVVNFTVLTGLIYSKGYLAPYLHVKNKMEMGIHFFSFFWLHLSMLLVTMFRDGLAFLVAWEIMSVSSFFLVIFDSEKPQSIKIGLKYLLQMHIGLIFILAAFLLSYAQVGDEFSFNGLFSYFMEHDPFLLFLLFFIGFGIKAGFIPLHSWLPHAHPAAPSHVSGVMSGVMIKMGIYGILRVLTYIHSGLLPIGIFILTISILSGLFGVTLAIVQHDLKKLLAYHSIENIGIIGIGIGLGVIGLAENIPVLAVLGFTGGILHVLNHSLFKSLLFYSAGSVYQQTHTLHIEHLGGLIKKMPKTAFFFLLGALAISGLPPFNGFISEFLIYSGLFKGLAPGNLFTGIIILFGIIGLVVIGGLAIFCFTKVFSIVFLGTSRSDKSEKAKEVTSVMHFPKILISVLIVFIGLAPAIFIHPVSKVAGIFTKDISIIHETIPVFNTITVASLLFIVLVIILWFVRKAIYKKYQMSYGSTWGCGYTGANPAIHQYTASSYADNLAGLAPVANVKKHYQNFSEEEVFAGQRKFELHSSDILEDNIVITPTNKLLILMEKIAVFQTGKLQHYLLYALVFLLIIFILTLFKLI